MSEKKRPTDEEILAMLGGDEEEAQEVVKVEGASGAEYYVLSVDEAAWFDKSMERYMDDYRFDNIADLQDLDRLLGLELLSYRYTAWLTRGVGYNGELFDEKAVKDHKQKVDQEIRLVKKSMGMDRKGRVESEQQSTADYLKGLLRRAEEFGIHRDNQIAKAMDILNETKKLIGLHNRCDEEERKHLGVELEDIFTWLQDVAIPEYDKIDAQFRENQRIWIHEVA